eukprot:SAG11_NODE_1108_length_5832_cov_2.338043_4_plen_127_part_00
MAEPVAEPKLAIAPEAGFAARKEPQTVTMDAWCALDLGQIRRRTAPLERTIKALNGSTPLRLDDFTVERYLACGANALAYVVRSPHGSSQESLAPRLPAPQDTRAPRGPARTALRVRLTGRFDFQL